MWNKKSKKLVTVIAFLAAMLLKVDATAFAQGQTANYGKNGVAYVLLNSEFSIPGVYRFNEHDGSVADAPWRLYRINDIDGKASGLAANQNNQVFLLSAKEGERFDDAPVGWLPTGIKFDENSPIYVSAAGPFDGGASDYLRDGYPSWHDWPSDNNSSSGDYWKRDQTYESKHFEYAVNFGGPVGVRFLNGVEGTTVGTPIWDGTYWPSSSSNAAAIKHPTDPRKIILPSHCGALSYYLYGTRNEPAIQAMPMDGTGGRDTYIFTQANGAGYFSGDANHAAGAMFGCIVKRIYKKRTNSLDLYAAVDNTTATLHPINRPMQMSQSGVLQTVDVKVRESYGKLCGDNCIEGGEIPGNKPIESVLSRVTVVTSTVGNRYGFNPLGKTKGASGTEASLRVVETNGSQKTIDISTDANGQFFNNKIDNRFYLAARNITPASIKTVGVSSNFSTSANNDFIYGSAADHFVVQDSWWGKGGVAYEYNKGDGANPGKVVKLDYVNNANPIEEDLGDLAGQVDSIAIDGDGYLYALKTEENPTDSQMEKILVNASSLAIDSSSFQETSGLPALDNSFAVALSGWKRNVTSPINTNGEIINGGEINIPEGQQRVGDYKYATLKQRVYKSVKRYPQATGSLGAEEPRGSLFAGYDTWNNKLKMTYSGVAWELPIWRQDQEASRTSSLMAELAVVNVADSPVSIPGTDKHQVIVINGVTSDGSLMNYSNGQVVGEQDSLTFKVEGYKPTIDGVPRSFKSIGNIGTLLANVHLNTIPAPDGTYAHDENGDGLKSGFPSTMFEASGRDTTVTWSIAQVENTTAVPLSSAKLISGIETRPGVGTYKSLNYKFLQPGRYIIQADLTYHFFTNFGTAARPTDLSFTTKTIKTEPLLVSVYANELKLNSSPSYITNISMDLTNNKKIALDPGAAGSDSDYDAVEGVAAAGSNEGKFGSIAISFDAHFVRESESNTVGNLQTYDGIGVWDYDYYGDLYQKAKGSLPGLIVPGKINRHVYNYASGNSLETCYNKNVYNPGKPKANSENGYTHTAGTEVVGELKDKDKEFIQWALYLRPVKPQEVILPNTSTQPEIERGDLILSGTCATASFAPLGDRKYRVSFVVDNIDSKINTPRDPQDYTIDMEIVYPRVTWLNNDLGASLGDGKNYFSSIVPYTNELGYAPIHVLSKFRMSGFTGNTVNQTSSGVYNDEKSSFTLCVRDKEKPTFEDKTEKLPRIQTTGEPDVEGVFVYKIEDNNPFLSDSVVTKNAAKKIETSEAINAVSLLTQELKSNASFEDIDANKKFVSRSDSKDVNIIQTSDEKGFYSDDKWRIALEYTEKLNPLAPSVFAPNGALGESPSAMGELNTLEKENWVGTLNYAITGRFYDGIGKDGKNALHQLYDPDAAGFAGYNAASADDFISSPMKPYLTRVDNDPPSIKVELISQSDNRRWEYQLIEGINDRVNNPAKVDDLAGSTLLYNMYRLSDTSGKPMESKNKQDIPGCQANPTRIPADLDSAPPVEAPPEMVMSVKRASRLLINTYVYDNCGFLPLTEATITVEEGGNTLLGKTDMKLGSSHDMNGNLKDAFKTEPRGVYAVDMPMKVAENQPQIKITVQAKDNSGNERILVVPVKLVESTFETRVLETKENRR